MNIAQNSSSSVCSYIYVYLQSIGISLYNQTANYNN